MIGLIRRLLKDRRGNTLAIAAAAMPMVIGCAGLATDTIQWTLWKRQLQRAADSAAIAGVYDRENAGGSTSNTSNAVSRDLAINNHVWMSLVSGYPQVTYPSDSGAEVDQVKVTLEIQQPLPFSSLFMSSAPVITATATAASISTGTPCALALHATGTAMNYSGNATVNAPTCILYSDSASADAASAGGSSAVTAKSIAAVGGIQQSNNFTVQSYIPYSPTIADPFSSITPDTSQMHCAGHWQTSNNGNGAGNGNATQTWVYDSLSESTDMTNATYLGTDGQVHTGANCWTSLSTSASNKTGLTVPSTYSGPIYIDANTAHGGNGSVNMQGTFSCSSCTIVLTNSDSTQSTIGTWSANAQSSTTITAPTTGTYAGIAVFQDRRGTGGNTDTINGGANNVVTGAVYFPKDTLQINGTGTATSLCAMWVANNITFLGNSSIAISSPNDTACSGKVAGTNAAVKMVRLVA
jgi:hypothetical protein